MRKFWIAILALVASSFFFGACFNKGGGDTNTGTSTESSATVAKLATPQSLKMDSKGTLSWSAVENATAYNVTIDGVTTTTDKTKIDLTGLVSSAGDYTVSVTVTHVWTPAGMIEATRSANVIIIDGTIYDDWYQG